MDNFKGAIKFFKDVEEIQNYLNENKDYSNLANLTFIGQEYTEPLEIEKVDLIISQYAGFVGQATKQYLKVGGILLCNDSHGDATLAKMDKDFQFIGVVTNDKTIQTMNVENYFKLPKDRPIDLTSVKEKMKGLNYKLKSENYLFQKIK
ncbi:MAG: hypothetical protein KC455_05260 [Carnobacterium sp.]|nr:hypothetical protein [Carnobacterium sp.]